MIGFRAHFQQKGWVAEADPKTLAHTSYNLVIRGAVHQYSSCKLRIGCGRGHGYRETIAPQAGVIRGPIVYFIPMGCLSLGRGNNGNHQAQNGVVQCRPEDPRPIKAWVEKPRTPQQHWV